MTLDSASPGALYDARCVRALVLLQPFLLLRVGPLLELEILSNLCQRDLIRRKETTNATMDILASVSG